MKTKKPVEKRYLVIRTVLILIGLVAWEVTSKMGMYNTVFTSYPTEIARDFVDFAKSGDLFYHTSITLKEAFLGLFIGSCLGVFFGVLFGQFRPLGKIFTPILVAINGIPQLTLAPVYVLWFGFGMTSKVFLSGLMVFMCVFFATYNSIRNTEQKLIESAHLLGANSGATLWYVVLPTCLPWIFSGIRSGVGACMVGAIIGEYMGAAGGFGWMVTYATSFFMVRRVMSCILILLFVGMFLNWLLDLVECRILRWKVETKLDIA